VAGRGSACAQAAAQRVWDHPRLRIPTSFIGRPTSQRPSWVGRGEGGDGAREPGGCPGWVCWSRWGCRCGAGGQVVVRVLPDGARGEPGVRVLEELRAPRGAGRARLQLGRSCRLCRGVGGAGGRGCPTRGEVQAKAERELADSVFRQSRRRQPARVWRGHRFGPEKAAARIVMITDYPVPGLLPDRGRTQGADGEQRQSVGDHQELPDVQPIANPRPRTCTGKRCWAARAAITAG